MVVSVEQANLDFHKEFQPVNEHVEWFLDEHGENWCKFHDVDNADLEQCIPQRWVLRVVLG